MRVHGGLRTVGVALASAWALWGCAQTEKPAEPAKPAASQPAAQPAPQPEARRGSAYRPTLSAGQISSAWAFPTGDEGTSAVLVHQVMPREARAGSAFNYEIHVTNLTRGSLDNVVISGGDANNLAIVSSTPSARPGPGGSSQWVIPSLAAGRTEVIKIQAKADKVGVSSQCLSCSYSSAICLATNIVQPALTLSKTITPEAMLCDPIQMKLEVKNSGSGAAENIVIKDALPAGLTTSDGKTTVEIPVGTLATGESKAFNVALKATKTGRFENMAQATAAGGLTADSAKVAVVVRQPVLTIEAKCTERVFVGRDMTSVFTIKNTGDGTCASTTVTMPIPEGATFVRASAGGAASGNTVTWSLGNVAPGETKTVEVVTRATTIRSFAFNATVRCACAEAKTAGCTTNAAGIPAILVETTDDPDPIEVGTETTYTIVVTNQGSAADSNVRIVCTLPDGLQFVSAGGATAGSAAGQTITFAPVATLAPKAKVTWTVKARAVRDAGDVRFVTDVSSDQFKNPIREIESTNLYK
ncbi:MAG: DUF11 domain-containing protein [Phycisphaerae bacterium]|nr:DUF11 domain-containing protein [Phycisphaerae bacterium]